MESRIRREVSVRFGRGCAETYRRNSARRSVSYLMQMFNTLCDKALENGGALKTHVTCLLDEFANQKIPNFQHLISVI